MLSDRKTELLPVPDFHPIADSFAPVSLQLAFVKESKKMKEKVLHILCPGIGNAQGWVIIVQPQSILTSEDCPVPLASNVSFEKFTPASLFRCREKDQVSVVVKHIHRG